MGIFFFISDFLSRYKFFERGCIKFQGLCIDNKMVHCRDVNICNNIYSLHVCVCVLVREKSINRRLKFPVH